MIRCGKVSTCQAPWRCAGDSFLRATEIFGDGQKQAITANRGGSGKPLEAALQQMLFCSIERLGTKNPMISSELRYKFG